MEPQATTPAERGAEAPCPTGTPPKSWRDSATLCALVAILGTGALGCLLMLLSVNGFKEYGVVLFCLSPGICGLVAVLLHEWARPTAAPRVGALATAVVGLLAALTALGLLLAGGAEGMICVLMALPFAFVMALVGTAIGAALAGLSDKSRPLPMLMSILVLYPAAQQYEASHPAPVVPRLIVTRLAVSAPPAQVWAALTRPVQYPAATGWFRAGVVYPTRTAFAQDAATGRRTLVCRYSQGLARLPVVAWQPGRQLTFAVPPADMPAPMHELSPYPQVHAPHLHGYFQVDSGTFRLRPLPGGRTLLEARTVYRHSIGPRFYWRLWSDYLLDAMHQRVLATLKAEAETLAPTPTEPRHD